MKRIQIGLANWIENSINALIPSFSKNYKIKTARFSFDFKPFTQQVTFYTKISKHFNTLKSMRIIAPHAFTP